MIYWKLAFRRLRRSLPLCLSLLFMCAAVIGCLFCNRAVTSLQAGYYAEGNGAETAKLCEGLEQYGYVNYNSEESLRIAVQNGDINCGAIFTENMEARLKTASLDGCVTFVVSPTSILPQLFSEAVVAELLYVAAPYFSGPILAELAPNVDLTEKIVRLYDDMQENGEGGFSFSLITVAGKTPTTISFGESLAIVVLSVFLFAVPLMQGCRLRQKNYRDIVGRIGNTNTVRTVFLPEMGIALLIELLAVMLTVLLGSMLSGIHGFITVLPAALIDAVLLTAVAMLITLIFRNPVTIQMLMVPTILLSLVFCPIFIDYGNLFPIIAKVRWLLPTYWLTRIPENLFLSAGVSFLVLAIAVIAFLLSSRRKKHSVLRI